MDGNSQLMQLEAENGTLENVEIAAGAIMSAGGYSPAY